MPPLPFNDPFTSNLSRARTLPRASVRVVYTMRRCCDTATATTRDKPVVCHNHNSRLSITIGGGGGGGGRGNNNLLSQPRRRIPLAARRAPNGGRRGRPADLPSSCDSNRVIITTMIVTISSHLVILSIGVCDNYYHWMLLLFCPRRYRRHPRRSAGGAKAAATTASR